MRTLYRRNIGLNCSKTAQSTLFWSCRARTLFQGGLIHKLHVLIISAETDNCPSFLSCTFDDRAYFWSYDPLKTETILVVSVIFLFFFFFVRSVT